MDFLARAAASYRRSRGDWPVDLAAIEQFLAEVDPRLPSFFHAATQDAWRRAIRYECCMVTSVGEATGKDTEPKPRLVSLGADGEPGGRGVDADLQTIPDRATLPLSQNEGNIQSELAEALNLAFQLEAIDYSHPSWRCSDMAIDQLKRELDRRGADFTVLEDTLAGTSFSGRIARILLQAVRLFDRFTDGAVSDTVKVVLIEMLADESLIEMSMQQFDPALMEVLIDERNQVVIDDLQQVLREQPGAQSIAVFYGAGHMQDLAERLRDQLGYAHEGGRWFKAISVDLTESAVSQREVLQMRLMIRRMMRQMSRMPRADSP
jgi:hypothetical protein